MQKYSVYNRFQEQDSIKLNLPKGWEVILKKNVLIDNILRKYYSETTKKLFHHLSWGDIKQSISLIDMIITAIFE